MSKKQVLGHPGETRQLEISSEPFLSGPILFELDPDEWRVWVGFLAFASPNSVNGECFSRDQLARHLRIDRDLLDRSIDKFIESGAVEYEFLVEERKEVFHITKWFEFQSDRQKRKVRDRISFEDCLFESIEDSSLVELEEKIEEKILPQNTLIEELKEILSLLGQCEGYPFDIVADERLIKKMINRFPEMDHIAVISRLIEWWELDPWALFEYDPRDTLEIWIQKEAIDS